MIYAAKINLVRKSGDLILVIVEKVDEKLTSIAQGVVCSSDTEIIEVASVAVFDLARYVITHHFEPDFFILKRIYLPDKLQISMLFQSLVPKLSGTHQQG